eukprot:TRINITY_DN89_c2_g2_i1.p1 TRINITY_DN89_c2_g2~~TRINITY_DN89_c2_g2_i1.p1  ORF type:complete len:127 (-),score=25.00 TRINITY_DN89_c2_g2_i1:841-1221(-)
MQGENTPMTRGDQLVANSTSHLAAQGSIPGYALFQAQVGKSVAQRSIPGYALFQAQVGKSIPRDRSLGSYMRCGVPSQVEPLKGKSLSQASCQEEQNKTKLDVTYLAHFGHETTSNNRAQAMWLGS